MKQVTIQNTDNLRLAKALFKPVLVFWNISSNFLGALAEKRNPFKDATIYDFEVTDAKGNKIKMDTFKGKTLIMVNTATKCGLAPQFEGLEAIHQKYKDDGVVILGFPCNQFANQEPGNNESIASSCSINFGVTFPIMAKIDVNGDNAHPLFKYLKSKAGGFISSDIKWNFTKFVVSKAGKPIKRFSPLTSPEKIEEYIQKIL